MYETKAIGIVEDKIDIKNGTVAGYLAVFGNIDKVGDIIEPTAFDKTLRERKKILHLFNHDFSRTTGFFDVLETDGKGLYFEKNLDVEVELNGEKIRNSTASDLLTLYANGVISEHSIGYRAVKYEIVPNEASQFEFWDDAKQQWVRGFRVLKEIKLYEGSSLTMEAANPLTSFLGFKSLKNNEKSQVFQNYLKKIKEMTKKSIENEQSQNQILIALEQLSSMFQPFLEPSKDTRQQEPVENATPAERQIETLRQMLQILKN